MTSKELYECFKKQRAPGMACGIDELRRLEDSAWFMLVEPYLAIPRSIKDDPPTDDQWVILIRDTPLEGKGVTIVKGHWAKNNSSNYKFEFWIPAPDLPKPDKDEQEFDEWINKNGARLGCGEKNAFRMVWMAARKGRND
jgi:hypothetical protein